VDLDLVLEHQGVVRVRTQGLLFVLAQLPSGPREGGLVPFALEGVLGALEGEALLLERLRCLNFQASAAVLATRQTSPSSAQRSQTQPARAQASMTTTAGRCLANSLRRWSRSVVSDSKRAVSGLSV
jgi:hypothetical protein